MLALLVVLSSSKKAFRFVALPWMILWCLYLPIGFTYGKLTYSHVISAYVTDASEAQGFLSTLSWHGLLIGLGTLALFGVYRWLMLNNRIYLYRSKALMVLILLVGLSNQAPFGLFNQAHDSVVQAQVELHKIAESQANFKDEWGVVSSLETPVAYEDYVVVIGESARRDYLHAYGYPVSNTPFLDKVNGVFVDGLKSADMYTIPSLTRMLTKNHTDTHEANYNLDVVTLAKKAGYETHWLSNQGYLGEHDTPISAIASRADVSKFLKKGSYDSNNTSDFELIPIFEQQLAAKTTKKRLFFLHIYGSHQNACNRILDFPVQTMVKDKVYAEMACYVNSLHKTDVFLEKVYAALKQNGRPFSMVYFSDHGLSSVMEDGLMKMVHGTVSRQKYDVPLVKISSDDHARVWVKSAKSGYYFTDGLAQWLNISSSHLEHYNLFATQEPEPFKVDFPNFTQHQDNPVIDISNK